MSLCNFPSFLFVIPLPIKVPTLPSLPSFAFSLAFTLPCPLD